MLDKKHDDAAKVNKALYYLDDTTNRLWKEYEAKDDGTRRTWDEFKIAIRLLYPGADLQRLYSIDDFEGLVLANATRGINTRVEYGKFYREFSLISAYLLKEKRVDERYVEKWFMLAFGPQTRSKIERRLYMMLPDHHPDDPYRRDDIKKAAEFLLQGNIRASDVATATASPAQPATEAVMSEPTEIQRLAAQVMSLSSTVAQLATRSLAPPPNSPAAVHATSSTDTSALNPALRLTPFPEPQSRPKGCHYCQGPHIMRNCDQIKEDLLQGRCKKTTDNKIAFWNGTVITRDYPGTTFADQVKRYNVLFPPPSAPPPATMRDSPPHMAANIVEVTDVLYSDATEVQSNDETGPYATLEDEDLLSMVTVLQNEIARKAERKRGRMQFAGVEIPARSAQAKAADARPGSDEDSVAKSPGTSGPSGKGKGPAAQGDSGPQYRYQSPIENAEAARRIMDRLMDQQITISQKDLLAAMPELRKNFKEQVSGKRVPVASATVYDEADVYFANYTKLTDRTVVGRDQVPLRCVTAMVNDCADVECLLDNGSSIIVMHVDIWRRIGLPLTDDVMMMETANSTKDPTLGRLKNVRFAFQGLELMLQVQVVQRAPCEVLLGRPFFVLTACITKDFMDGNQHITISDPNGTDSVTIPTRPRLRKGPVDEGFMADDALAAMADVVPSLSDGNLIEDIPTEQVRFSRDLIPLRCVKAIVNDLPDVECLLDSGSSVIAMRADTWQRIGLPLTDEVVTMEAADSTKDQTLGRLENVRFAFQGVELVLQVQVVQKAPCEVLLGRPFFVLTACVTEDFVDGNQNITISDPNGTDSATIPTLPCVRTVPGVGSHLVEDALAAMADVVPSSADEDLTHGRPTKRARFARGPDAETAEDDPEMPALEYPSSDSELAYPDDEEDGPTKRPANPVTQQTGFAPSVGRDIMGLRAVLTAGLHDGTPYPWDGVSPKAKRFFHPDRFSVIEEDNGDLFVVIDHTNHEVYRIDPRKVDEYGFSAKRWLAEQRADGKKDTLSSAHPDVFDDDGTYDSEDSSPSQEAGPSNGSAGWADQFESTLYQMNRIPRILMGWPVPHSPSWSPLTPLPSSDASSGGATKGREVIDLTREDEVIDLTGDSDEEPGGSEAFF